MLTWTHKIGMVLAFCVSATFPDRCAVLFIGNVFVILPFLLYTSNETSYFKNAYRLGQFFNI